MQGMHTQTFSLRICWTTDGLNLMVPNCYQSPSHTAAVMDRGKWDSSLNIVGHMGIVTVIRASPLLYKSPDGNADPICIFAMGAQAGLLDPPQVPTLPARTTGCEGVSAGLQGDGLEDRSAQALRHRQQSVQADRHGSCLEL